jgi:hypothetical protein
MGMEWVWGEAQLADHERQHPHVSDAVTYVMNMEYYTYEIATRCGVLHAAMAQAC